MWIGSVAAMQTVGNGELVCAQWMSRNSKRNILSVLSLTSLFPSLLTLLFALLRLSLSLGLVLLDELLG
jgi:hypothetical protein